MEQEARPPHDGATKHIHILVEVDAQRIPEAIFWQADDAGQGFHPAKALALGLWDEASAGGIHIGLWTKRLTIAEMSTFVYQTLHQLADSYAKATHDEPGRQLLAEAARRFAAHVQQTESGDSNH